MSEESERPKPPAEPKPVEVLHADDLPQILKRNPRKFWLHPFLWWSWKRTEILYQSYSQQRVGLDDWERQWLIPQLKGRVGFIAKLLNEIKAVCANPNVREQIGPAIVELGAAPTMDDPRVLADDYLNRVASQVDNDFLKTINDANEETEHVKDLRSLLRFVNTVRFIATQITSTESTLFWYSSWIYPIIIDKHTGKPIRSGTSQEFGIILLPFKNVIGNLMGVATTTIALIDHWGQQLSERKKPFLEYLAGDALLRANRLAI